MTDEADLIWLGTLMVSDRFIYEDCEYVVTRNSGSRYVTVAKAGSATETHLDCETMVLPTYAVH